MPGDIALSIDASNSSTINQFIPSTISVPIGSSIPWNGTLSNLPTGFLNEDGSAVSRTTYASLFAVIGTINGVGDLSTTFNLPDTRGGVIRAVDGTAGRDPDKAVRTALVGGTWSLTASSTNSTSTITVTSTTNVAPGMSVSGTNIPASSCVLAILSSTTFQLGNTSATSVNASGTGSGISLTFSKAATANYAGSFQSDIYTSHSHTLSGIQASTSQSGSNVSAYLVTGGSLTTLNSGGNETRGKNMYKYMLIRAF